jgi:RNA polymerase sigma factor (sigma-70 family)
VDSDSELMCDVRAGRVRALATLFERHHARVYRFCVRMTGDRQASEDLVQDIFMRILTYAKSYRDDMPFVPWLFGIARNACRGHLGRAPRVPADELDVEDMPAELAAHDDRAAADERAELVRRALSSLPVERREVLVLSRYEFKTYEEIARVLGCSVGAVKVRVHRAMKELRTAYLALVQEISA